MKMLVVTLLLSLGLSFAGCTMSETAPERRRRIANNWNIQLHQLVEDWDYLMLMDRPTQLNASHVRTGLSN